MNFKNSKDIVTCAGVLGAGIIASFTYLRKQKIDRDSEVEKLKVEASYPPEYWIAKQEEAKANCDIRKAEIDSSAKLKIHERNLEDGKIKERMKFEKDAPPEYWAYKETEEKERSRRHQMDLDNARSKERDRIDRDIARRNAQAMETGAKSLERAVTGFNGK